MLRSENSRGKTPSWRETTGARPAAGVESGHAPAAGLAGTRLLTKAIRATGLDDEVSRALSPWRRPWAIHDPGMIMADLAVCAAPASDFLARS